MFKKIVTLVGLMMMVSSLSFGAEAKKEFNVCWSHYTGWEPWAYADSSGILKKWADKYGVTIKLTRINDYVESMNLYTAGKFDACAMTNMDVLTIPALGGIDSTGLIVGDFSNGNDAIVAKKATTLTELKNRSVMLVQFSVSHYLLSRALSMNGMKESELKLLNTSDADIGSTFLADPNAATVTWNPIVMNIKKAKNTNVIFDSSKIPGEIIDLMIVKTNASEDLKKALVGAWYETMAVMSAKNKAGEDSVESMAKEAGSSVEDFKAQLKTTAMFYTPKEATEFAQSPKLEQTMKYVRDFSFDKGLYNGKTQDAVGIEFDNGTVLGNKDNVKLRFTSKYMKMASDGSL